MKVLVKNIRHLNESVFQGMFDKAFSRYANKKQINESEILNISDISYNLNERKNIATYFKKGLFIGSAISLYSNLLPTSEDSLIYPYVPIAGYGFNPIGFDSSDSTTALKKTGIGQDEEIKERFIKAYVKNTDSFISPKGIIIGHQQTMTDTTKKVDTNPFSRKQTWGLVGNANAFQQICRIDETTNEIVFDENIDEPYQIFRTKTNSESNMVESELTPVDDNFLCLFGGDEHNRVKIVRGFIIHIISFIKSQCELLKSGNSSALSFLTSNVPIDVDKKSTKDEYKPIPSELYREVFSIIKDYIIEKIGDSKDINSEYDYIINPSTSQEECTGIELAKRFFKKPFNESYLRFQQILTTQEGIDYFKNVNISDNEKKIFFGIIKKLVEQNNEDPKNKKLYCDATINKLKEIIGKNNGKNNEKNIDYSEVRNLLSNIINIIKSNEYQDKEIINRITNHFGKTTTEQYIHLIRRIYLDPEKQYYYWKETTIPNDRKNVLLRLFSYNVPIGDTGAHMATSKLAKPDAAGFSNLIGDSLSEKIMNAFIHAYENKKNNGYTFKINRTEASSRLGDKITSTGGKQRAFVLFKKITNKEYNYTQLFSKLKDKGFSRIPQEKELPRILYTKRMEGIIVFLEENDGVEKNINSKEKYRHTYASGRTPIGRFRPVNSSITGKTIALLQRNAVIGFNVLMAKHGDNYFFIDNYSSEYFNPKKNLVPQEDVSYIDIGDVNIPDNLKFDVVDRLLEGASQINYGAVFGSQLQRTLYSIKNIRFNSIDDGYNEYQLDLLEEIDGKHNEDNAKENKTSTSFIDIPDEETESDNDISEPDVRGEN